MSWPIFSKPTFDTLTRLITSKVSGWATKNIQKEKKKKSKKVHTTYFKLPRTEKRIVLVLLRNLIKTLYIGHISIDGNMKHWNFCKIKANQEFLLVNCKK